MSKAGGFLPQEGTLSERDAELAFGPFFPLGASVGRRAAQKLDPRGDARQCRRPPPLCVLASPRPSPAGPRRGARPTDPRSSAPPPPSPAPRRLGDCASPPTLECPAPSSLKTALPCPPFPSALSVSAQPYLFAPCPIVSGRSTSPARSPSPHWRLLPPSGFNWGTGAPRTMGGGSPEPFPQSLFPRVSPASFSYPTPG